MEKMILEYLNLIPGGEYLQNKYVLSLLIVLLFAFLGKMVLLIFSKYLEKIASKTKTKFDDLVFEHTKKPIFYLVIVYGLKLALLNLKINGIITNFINSAMALVFLLILLRTLDVIIEVWGNIVAKKTKTKIDEILLPLFHKSAKVIFIIISLMWVLKIWGVDITPYLAGVGISGLVLGMALQDSLKNVFGGISLILDKNFNIGDAVRLESGELGTITEIGLRSTKMLSYDNEVIFIPNGQLSNMRIRNYVKPNTKVRKIVNFSVGYGTDPDRVKKIILKVLQSTKEIHDEPYKDVIFKEMGDSGLHFQARFWVDWNNAYGKWLEITQEIYTALNKAGIEIPYPTRTIYMKK